MNSAPGKCCVGLLIVNCCAGWVWCCFYARKAWWANSLFKTKGNLFRHSSSNELPSHLQGYCGNKAAMATVAGVIVETTVTMTTASQRVIFEASKEEAPSLIAACAWKKAALLPLLRCVWHRWRDTDRRRHPVFIWCRLNVASNGTVHTRNTRGLPLTTVLTHDKGISQNNLI